ncbi:MAG: ABC transporter transmembrane domain-containing protein [Treponema sp.]
MRVLQPLIRKYRLESAFVVLVTTLCNICALLYHFYYKNMIDALSTHNTHETYRWLITVAVLQTSTELLTFFIYDYYLKVFKIKIAQDVKASVFRRLFSFPFHTSRSLDTGMLTVILSEDTAAIGDYTALYYFILFGNTVRFVITYYLLWQLDPFISLFVLCTVPLYYVLARFSFQHIKEAAAQERTASDTVVQCFLDYVSNLKTVKAASLETILTERFNTELDRHFCAQRHLLRWNSVMFFIRNFLHSFLPLIIVGLCVYRILLGSITIGTLFAISGFISAVYLPVGELLYFMSMRHNLQPVLDRTKDYLSERAPLLADKRIIIAGNSADSRDGSTAGSSSRSTTAIAVENMSYTYDDTPVFNCISFTVQGHGLYLVEGANGKGKTTLFNILSGLYTDYSGEIRLTVSDTAIQPIAYMIQENQLFEHASYRENLTLFGADEPVVMPDTVHQFFEQTAERKNGYSGGEKRLCLFLRTISRKAHIYLFDEPLENLDTAMRDYVISTIRQLAQTKLVLVISHGNDFDDGHGDIRHLVL